MQTVIDMTFDEWVDKYKPHCDSDGSPIMYETYGDDLDRILDIPESYIWTYVDGGDYSGISNGFQTVNRLNYYICTVPFDINEIYYVDLYEMTLCDMDEHIWVEHKRYDGTPVTICSECEVDQDATIN